MIDKTPYESSDGAVGYITDVTNEHYYTDPQIELYDELEQDCYKLVCDFAGLIGVQLDSDEIDYSMANQVRDSIIEMLEEQFKVPFPVYGENAEERTERIARAKEGFAKLFEEFDDELVKDALSLDEQIAVASASKEYELTLFQGKENEQMIRAFLTEEQVEMICKGISGVLNSEYNITFPDGSVLGVGCIDAIEILDGDCLLPGRHKAEEIERE